MMSFRDHLIALSQEQIAEPQEVYLGHILLPATQPAQVQEAAPFPLLAWVPFLQGNPGYLFLYQVCSPT